MAATPAWLASIEALLNRGIESSLQAADLAHRLQGTALQLEVTGVSRIRASVFGARLALVSAEDPEPNPEPVNATIIGSPFALLRLARGDSKVRGSGAAQVRGDAEIANSYRQLFAMARPDMEEELSRLVGDLPARRMSHFAAQTVNWARKARRAAGENIAEYLQEESRDLVNKTELDEFLQGVDALRETADRIEARLARLEERLKGSR